MFKKYRTPRKKISLKTAFSNPLNTLAFGFGTGTSKYMPGTIGTLPAYPLYILMEKFFSFNILLAITTCFFIWGINICQKAGDMIGEHDHSGIVWDEIVAMLLILCFVEQTIESFVLAFILFRVFDIIKPWPINYFDEKLQNGFGVMFDDLLAAIFALGSYWLIIDFI